ncbi:oligopeptide/dipeptide ABC transporter ATP-binding protein [Nocardioides soli]|uniref:Oligopeptide/dipeptide ABC transporter ATP-binding protein n=1 Tax=Nocardioides soli TaxID=1036020 RepID=A0A7W4Z065_9ACTN|nr:ABC transporter ATP-binding protein [Nocardioides soli]MBB3041523.1 oligopeptide/dipeptide ABC transporter ATP-binding protein [Nocardioides soli]
MSMLVAEGLEKHFRIDHGGWQKSSVLVRAVSEVSFAVERGEVMTIVGESGCGKSTVARMLVGLVEPTRGTIAVDGVELRPERTARDRRLIQLVAQNPWSAFNRRRTLGHSLAQPLLVNKVETDRRQRRARIEEMVERVGLSAAHLASRPSDVSGGELARAALARALLLSPKVLVLDEPTASLDASVKATVIDLLRELRADLDLSIVLITHEIDVARMIADRAAVMYLGRLVESGAAELVLRRPSHPYTRMLLDSVPDPDPDHRELAAAKGEVPSSAAAPHGCAYHPRCHLASDECGQERPELLQHAGVEVACHRILDVGMPLLMPGSLPEDRPEPAVAPDPPADCARDTPTVDLPHPQADVTDRLEVR